MELNLRYYEVSHLEFGSSTMYEAGILTINKSELTALLEDDPRIESADVELVLPGTSTRIGNILDVLEPRIKTDAETYFPGIFGPLYRAGEGDTNVLRGVTVLEIGSLPEFYGGLLDTSGRGAELSSLAKKCHVCILPTPKEGLSVRERGLMLKDTGMKASVYLARATIGVAPDEVETFDVDMADGDDRDLPRVAYLMQLHSHADSREPFIYGENTRRYYPTIIHPNEVMDGAIVNGAYDLTISFKNLTYSFLNHPVVLGLYRRHNKDLRFKGVVVAPEPVSLVDKRRTSLMSAGLLKNALGASGVVITKEGGGHTDVDLMENCDACERLGIGAVLIDNEWLGADGDGESPLIAVSDRADALVSVGNVDELVDLPAPDRVVGGLSMTDGPDDLSQPIRVQVWTIPGTINQFGLTYLAMESR